MNSSLAHTQLLIFFTYSDKLGIRLDSTQYVPFTP